MERKHYHYLLALIFNLVLLLVLYRWFVQHVNLTLFLKDLRVTHSASIIVVFVLYVTLIFLVAIRFSKLQGCSYYRAVHLVAVAYGLNNVLPFRAGDLFRLYYARKTYDYPVSQTLITTFVSRYLDLLMLLICGASLLFFNRVQNDNYVVYLFTTLFGLSIATVFLYRVLIVCPGKINQLFRKVSFLNCVLDSLEQLMMQPKKIKLFFVSGLIWGAILMIYYLFFSINLPNHPFHLLDAALLMFTTTLCFAIPYSIAGLGVFEAAITYCLVKFVGVASAKALALAIVFHIMTALPQVLVMLVMVTAYRSERLASL